MNALVEINNFEDLKEYLPFLIPLAVIQLSLMIAALVSIFRHKTYKTGNRAAIYVSTSPAKRWQSNSAYRNILC